MKAISDPACSFERTAKTDGAVAKEKKKMLPSQKLKDIKNKNLKKVIII